MQRYEMNYYEGEKSGIWRMWDENGTIVDEKEY
jgi:antitoxin component YwqK of YwqJK toxin-antitoxin module